MRVSASESWRETTNCRSVCLKRVNFMPAKGVRLWVMVAHMPSASWSRWESQHQQMKRGARVPGPLCTGRSHLGDKRFIFSSKLVSECVCMCACARVYVHVHPSSGTVCRVGGTGSGHQYEMSWGPTLLLKGFTKALVFGKQRIRSFVLKESTNMSLLLKGWGAVCLY